MRSLSFCCSLATFNNLSPGRDRGYHPCMSRLSSSIDATGSSNLSAEKMASVNLKKFWRIERIIHPGHGKKQREGKNPLWSRHRYLCCTYLSSNQVIPVSPSESHFSTKEDIILKCAVTTSVSSRCIPPFQGCSQNVPPDLLMASSACSGKAALLTWLTLHSTGFWGFPPPPPWWHLTIEL